MTPLYAGKNLMFLKPYWESGLRELLESIYMRW